jgi:hypothetical protein
LSCIEENHIFGGGPVFQENGESIISGFWCLQMCVVYKNGPKLIL